MNCRPITINDNYLNQTLTSLQTGLSEYCFSNIFAFSNKHNYFFCTYKNHSFILGKHYEGYSFIMPLFIPNTSHQNIFQALLKKYDFLYPIPEKWEEFFPKSFFQIQSFPSDSDYIFNNSSLATMSGRNLSKKRNLIKQFLLQTSPTFQAFSPINKNDCLSILKQWANNYADDLAQTDYLSCTEAIIYSEKLNLSGFIFYNNKAPIGFVLGNNLGNNMFDLQFAKADINLKGIYQYMFQKTSQLFINNYEFINFEQDLGIPQLKQMKASYQPITLNKKLRVKLL